MRNAILTILALLVCHGTTAQNTDTSRFYRWYTYNFTESQEFVIKNILVEEAENKPIQKSLVVVYSGLSIGQKIKIPGNDIPNAIDNLWKLSYYSDIQVYMRTNEVDGVKNATLNFVVKEQLRINGHRFLGLSNSQAKSLKDEAGLKRGMYITPNLINKTRVKIIQYYYDKGYYNATVKFNRLPALDEKTGKPMPGFENFDIVVDKGPKVKVYDFAFHGNEKLSDKQLRQSIKKLKRRYHKINIFASSKYIEVKFAEEKENIITRYLSKGFRDARILKDSLVLINPKRVVIHVDVFEGNKYHFRNIIWKGNSKYRIGFLDTVLGIKKGDIFNQTLLDERLGTVNTTGVLDIQSLYMDDGYLFFQITPVETGVFSDSIDLEIRINEGTQAKVGRVSWTGNTKTNDKVILREIRTKPGDVFSRAEIQRTMRDLAAIGLFDPQQLNVNPKPNPADGTVDIDYKLVEKPIDQIELSGGWGGNAFTRRATLIGTAGITLNNFSTRQVAHPKNWNPVPTGDGQKLSLRAQSNGSNYQGYNFSFTEPWFGGRKPNSFSVSLFRTVNAFDFRQRTDPKRQYFMNTGMSVMLGKRLKWPDDFFNLQYIFSFQQYKMQNLTSGFYGFPDGFNGTSYNPSLQVILTRSSVSDPIFPTSGSTLALSAQGTPPFSLLRNTEVSKLTQQEKYKWAEFYKWKLDMEWFTLITKKLVLMNKARFGFLGYYNKQMGIPFFERFQVGGAGIFGFNIAAAEIISQRGYDNFSISSTVTGSDAGAPIFNKFTSELRYAITTGQTATVYALAFLEAGDAWNSMRAYNPFQLKRSAGVGMRLFMPMFGLIGLDFAYGFDYRQVPRSGKAGQVHFFIGQQF
ncbi:MAG: outer membrane protein assembly factor BamA [Bacteroidetes bacterium]|nr:outer membrane protein assembly factor BamA [Bacteroidota bacterium]